MIVTCSYLSKSDSLGKFIWADVFPDKFEDYKYGFNSSFSIDNLQNIYRLSYNGILNDLDPGPDTFYLTNPIPFKINSAISKLNSDGNFLWAKKFISPKSNLIIAIENDNNDNIFIVGSFRDTINFGTEANQIIYTSDNLFDNNYTTKLDKNGNHIWSYIIKNRTNLYNKIICDSSDNLHYIGTYKEKQILIIVWIVFIYRPIQKYL
ncbi:MAG: hypothetical protein IPL95_18855 [Saprospiraceae bacterium]|nr:hypothetical protein [Saprospiraceae bacterium]